VVFASNLLEHPYREASNRLLTDAKRMLRPGGRLILVQSNVRLNRGRYFDDFPTCRSSPTSRCRPIW
jgi:hypothetical protein